MKLPESLPKERRHLHRYPASELQVFLSLRQGLIRAWHEVGAFDFTRAGVSVVWPGRVLQEGTQLELRLRLPLLTGDLVAGNLIAQVRNRHDIHGEASYGLAFDYAASRHMRNLETQSLLGRIEGILDRSEQQKERQLAQEALAKQAAEYEADLTGDPSIQR